MSSVPKPYARDAFATVPFKGKHAVAPMVLNPNVPRGGDPLGQRADARSAEELDRDADEATNAKLADLGGGTDPDNGRPLA